MRAVLCCALALSCPAVCFGGTFRVLTASATYWTATDEVEFRLHFNEPLNLNEDFVSFSGALPRDGWPPIEGFGIDNRWLDRSSVFSITHTIYDRSSGREVRHKTDMGTVIPLARGSTLSVSIPFSQLGIASPFFRFGAFAADENNEVHGAGGVQGVSGIDQRIVNVVPEPSGFLLSSLALLSVPIWRRYRRARRQVQ